MSMLIPEINPVLTQPFNKVVVAAKRAIVNREIIGIVGPDGIGFKYALKAVARKHYLKVIVCTVEHSQTIYNVLVSLNTAITNIKLPAIITQRPTSLFNVMHVTNTRIMNDDAALIVFDHCSHFKKSQLQYFISFLRKYNRHTGILYRMTPTYVERIKRRWNPEYKNLKKATSDWGVLEDLDDDDLREIVKAHGITDCMLVEDLVNNCENDVTILSQYIDRLKAYPKKNEL